MNMLPDFGSASKGSVSDVSGTRQRRVRTGCLTCRKRHLKCDEALPFCSNCRKSNRKCKRGVRLNFIDTTIQAPPSVPQSMFWHVTFQDESRDIASEYRGGLARYNVETTVIDEMPQLHPSGSSHAPTESQALFPSIEGLLPDNYVDGHDSQAIERARSILHTSPGSHDPSIYSPNRMAPQMQSSRSISDDVFSPPSEPRKYLDSREEVLFMQVYVEEVGLWMDSLDTQKHFSQLLPSQALIEPMLLNAFLACGARHLTSVNANYGEDRALHYYDTATRSLLNALQDPNRNMATCATTAVILNVYEIMCESALQRMNHIAGARALIKECGWNAQSKGVGAACFWLNIGMELLSNLHFNWQLAWNPDNWGLDMDFSGSIEHDSEETWTHRMVYIIAKVANFRAIISKQQELAAQDEMQWISPRYMEWEKLNNWCDVWNDSIPRTMQPLGYVNPYQTSSKSAFPEVWIIKRIAIVARLFYHTAKCLLAQINPLSSSTAAEMKKMQDMHSRQVCGIVAHVRDRGVASVSLRSLAIASECLNIRVEQEEVLQIFDKIQQETGWRVGFVHDELKEKWGWNNAQIEQQGKSLDDKSLGLATLTQHQEARQQQRQQQTIAAAVIQQTTEDPLQQRTKQQSGQDPDGHLYNCQSTQAHSQNCSSATLSRPNHRRMAGILNPVLAAADFSMPQHPYQSHYVAPNTPNATTQSPY